MTQDILIAVIIKRQYEKALQTFDSIVLQTREVIRHGRVNP